MLSEKELSNIKSIAVARARIESITESILVLKDLRISFRKRIYELKQEEGGKSWDD